MKKKVNLYDRFLLLLVPLIANEVAAAKKVHGHGFEISILKKKVVEIVNKSGDVELIEKINAQEAKDASLLPNDPVMAPPDIFEIALKRLFEPHDYNTKLDNLPAYFSLYEDIKEYKSFEYKNTKTGIAVAIHRSSFESKSNRTGPHFPEISNKKIDLANQTIYNMSYDEFQAVITQAKTPTGKGKLMDILYQNNDLSENDVVYQYNVLARDIARPVVKPPTDPIDDQFLASFNQLSDFEKEQYRAFLSKRYFEILKS